MNHSHDKLVENFTFCTKTGDFSEKNYPYRGNLSDGRFFSRNLLQCGKLCVMIRKTLMKAQRIQSFPEKMNISLRIRGAGFNNAARKSDAGKHLLCAREDRRRNGASRHFWGPAEYAVHCHIERNVMWSAVFLYSIHRIFPFYSWAG